MLAVLLSATQWTVYLSLTAFIGGGLIGLIFTLLRITPINWIGKICCCLHLDFPVRSPADAFILARPGDPDFLSS
ncbi:MAG: hypothetical protein Ct9H300mP28_32190 [Pseudomonadota bacterium]|nr:MAG: hypothetical protein Ct9H300mP28_32190 [Pseudomonadota bacterium]